MKTTPIILLISLLFVVSCGTPVSKTAKQQSEDNIVYNLDLKELSLSGTGSENQIYLNDLAKQITFVPLELTPQSILGSFAMKLFPAKDGYLISEGVFGDFKLIKFDSTGRCMNTIFRKGNGPGELPRASRWAARNSRDLLCLFGQGKIVVNSLDGKHQGDIRPDKNYGMIEPLNNGGYVCSDIFREDDQQATPYLTFLDDDGQVIHSILYKDDKRRFSKIREGGDTRIVYETYRLTGNYDGDVLFKDIFNDTIYKIKDCNNISPYIVLNRGELMPTEADFRDYKSNSERLHILDYGETSDLFTVKYIYNGEVYCAIFDKTSTQAILNVKIEDMLSATANYRLFSKYRTPQNEVLTLHIIGLSKNKIYCMIQSSDAAKFIPNIDENSNPVVMVVDL